MTDRNESGKTVSERSEAKYKKSSNISDFEGNTDKQVETARLQKKQLTSD